MISKKKITKLLTVVLLLILTGCAKVNEKDYKELLNKDNDIVSYEKVDTKKLVITIDNNINANTEPIKRALEERYPNITILTSIGSNYDYMFQQAQNNELSDIIFYSYKPEFAEYYYDLSAEEFTNRYNLTSLHALSVDDKIYQLPVASSAMGIFYNKTLFEEKGWEIPQTLDEFYALCETIEKDGIRPFVPCFKYASTVSAVGLGLSSQKVFGNVEKANQFYDFTSGDASCEGVLEPFLTSLRTLYQKGIINDDDFKSSATQNRYDMYDGKIAMIPYSLNLVSFYDMEKPDCELGFIGFPSDVYGKRYMPLANDESCMSLSRKSMEDPEKKAILLDVFDYFSTNEGQSVLFQCFTGISSLKSYQTTVTSRFEEVDECIDHGRMYFPQQFWTNSDLEVIKEWITTDMDISDMIEAMDEIVRKGLNSKTTVESIGTATETFSLLETSMFMADCIRETTSADVALVLNNTLYKGLVMKLYKGDITIPGIFYIRGLGGDNYLSVYEITGANLKLLMEHPIILGEEVNAVYAPSGLKITYAPWNDLNSNVLELTLPDGTPIEDDKIYRVAAWDSTIDSKYITSVVQVYKEYSSTTEYMTEVIKNKQTVTPTKDGRFTLVWE